MTAARRGIDEQRWLPVVNTSSEDAPPHAIMQITGIDADSGVLTVTRPLDDDLDPGVLLANGPTTIPAGGAGQGTQHWPARARVSSTGATTYGTQSGSWTLLAGGAGFRGVAHATGVTDTQLVSRGCC